jgi:hypothetical protein
MTDRLNSILKSEVRVDTKGLAQIHCPLFQNIRLSIMNANSELQFRKFSAFRTEFLRYC